MAGMNCQTDRLPFRSIWGCGYPDRIDDTLAGACVIHVVGIGHFNDGRIVDMVGLIIFQHDAFSRPRYAVGRFGQQNAIVSILALSAIPHAKSTVFEMDIRSVHVAQTVRRRLGFNLAAKHDDRIFALD